MARVVIGSRGSTLALVQAGTVREVLQKKFPSLKITVVPIRTQADRDLNTRIDRFPGKGIFVKEIEEALLAGKIDLAIHSLKDVPSALPPGLEIAAIPRREDPRDCLVTLRPITLEELPEGTRIGTGSPRRACQILARRPDLHLHPVRGNVGTRLRKMREGEFDALILAMAGLNRLGIKEYGILPLDPEICLPAPAQGALGIEVRSADDNIRRYLTALNHSPSSRAVKAERSFLETLGGGCRVPIGALANLRAQGKILLRGMLASENGQEMLRFKLEGKGSPESLGERLARRFLDRGGDKILNQGTGSG
jgi:hydroxymethylbilane synthase